MASTASAVVPEGFGTVSATVTAADGTVCEVCLWEAATAEERGQGLRAVTSLGGADGMVFVYPQPVENTFWMFQTVMALSIAWVGADGVVVSVGDMDPCVADDSSQCAHYAAAAPFTLAIEVPQGTLGDVALAAGSTVVLGSQDCPLD